jgi:arylsulfatase A
MQRPDRRTFLKTMGVAAAMAGCGLAPEGAGKSRPNIVYVLADDLGYGDLSCLNPQSRIRTRHMDALAAQGRIFTDAHSASAVCTPTRYALLTGRYAWRTRLKSGVLWGYSPSLIPPSRMTVARLLKNHGYRTACIGKWHLGLDWRRRDDRIPQDNPEELGENVDLSAPISGGPLQLGFDYFFGIPASLDMAPYVYIENDRVTAMPDRITENLGGPDFWRKGPTGPDFVHEEVLDVLARKAVQFIGEAKDPFFLYLPLTAPHTPVLPTAPFKDKSGTTSYGDFVLQIDDLVGQVLKALKEKGIEEETMVIVTSDNGFAPVAGLEQLQGLGHRPSYHFRGYKSDIFEGGHRIPFIVRWPGRVPAGTTSSETIGLTDLMATCAALLGDTLPPEAGEDSVNMLPAILGDAHGSPLREAAVHHSINGSFSIRKGKWKLILCPGSGGWGHPRPGTDEVSNLPPLQLYDMDGDPGETQNLQAEEPEIAEQLERLLTDDIKRGRSTPGPAQKNDTGNDWPQIAWMK